MDNPLIIAIVGLVGAMFSAYLSYRASTSANRAADEANRVAEKKVDAEAYERSQGFYEKMLQEADKHLDRLRQQVELLSAQLERVVNELNSEQVTSLSLRKRVHELQIQVSTMELTVYELRRQLNGSSSEIPAPTHQPDATPEPAAD